MKFPWHPSLGLINLPEQLIDPSKTVRLLDYQFIIIIIIIIIIDLFIYFI